MIQDRASIIFEDNFEKTIATFYPVRNVIVILNHHGLNHNTITFLPEEAQRLVDFITSVMPSMLKID